MHRKGSVCIVGLLVAALGIALATADDPPGRELPSKLTPATAPPVAAEPEMVYTIWWSEPDVPVPDSQYYGVLPRDGRYICVDGINLIPQEDAGDDELSGALGSDPWKGGELPEPPDVHYAFSSSLTLEPAVANELDGVFIVALSVRSGLDDRPASTPGGDSDPTLRAFCKNTLPDCNGNCPSFCGGVYWKVCWNGACVKVNLQVIEACGCIYVPSFTRCEDHGDC